MALRRRQFNLSDEDSTLVALAAALHGESPSTVIHKLIQAGLHAGGEYRWDS